MHSDVYKGLIKVGEKLTKQTLSQLIRLYIVFCVAEKPRREKNLSAGQSFLTIRQSERIVHWEVYYKNKYTQKYTHASI